MDAGCFTVQQLLRKLPYAGVGIALHQDRMAVLYPQGAESDDAAGQSSICFAKGQYHFLKTTADKQIARVRWLQIHTDGSSFCIYPYFERQIFFNMAFQERTYVDIHGKF